MKITYDPILGDAIRDGECETAALKDYEADADVKVASENYVNAVRVLIKEELIDYKKVTFVFGNSHFHPDINGRLNHWPKGFCDFTEDFLFRLIP